MIDKDGHIDRYTRRSVASKMAKVIERFVMDESLDNIVVRVDILNVQKAMEDLLKEYDALPPKLYVVRQYDKHDNQWIDVGKPMSLDEANKLWRENTSNGTRHTRYEDGIYFKVFRSDTNMIYSGGFGEA